MPVRQIALLFCLIGALLPVPAMAGIYCSAPQPPEFYGTKPTPPSKPYCVTVSNCEEWEIDSYNSDVEHYNGELETYRSEASSYIDDLNIYLRKAKEYAQCEVDAL